jgi:hypothetical protein
MFLATTPEANELLERDPFALLIGMLLDQRVVDLRINGSGSSR